MRALRYSFHEAVGSLWRGRQSALLSTSTIALALLVLGGFLIATANLQRLGAEWSSAAEMSVYLDDQITDQQRRAIEDAIAPGDIVEPGVGSRCDSPVDPFPCGSDATVNPAGRTVRISYELINRPRPNVRT